MIVPSKESSARLGSSFEGSAIGTSVFGTSTGGGAAASAIPQIGQNGSPAETGDSHSGQLSIKNVASY
jgi:hypothetical protein